MAIPNTGLQTTPEAIATYLMTLPHVTSATACTLVIRGAMYPAARYITATKNDPSTPAYRRGERIAICEMIYVAGPLPAVKRNGNVAFNLTGLETPDARDWYVAGYYPAYNGRGPQSPPDPESEFAEYHPFGWNFILAPWTTKDGVKIDTYERHPYKRVVATIA